MRVEYSAPPAAIKGADFLPLSLRLLPLNRTPVTHVLMGLAGAIAAISDAAAAPPTPAPIVLHGRTMGTTYNIKCWSTAQKDLQPPALQRDVDALLARFDLQVSTWRPDSELAQFNVAPANEWVAVSPDTVTMVARALELHRQTGGASDVTVGPVLRLWGFGPHAPQPDNEREAPSQHELSAARALVGAHRLHVRTKNPALCKDIDGLEVDLSSVASGYAVDRIVDQLAAAGIDNAMVELGGEVRAVGARPDGKPWRIGVERPSTASASLAEVLPLADLALATSGDFHNVHPVEGVRRTHIIDPRTGQPMPYRGVSITVFAETCFAADGIATALVVMGAPADYDWCVTHHVAALFYDLHPETGDAARRTSPRFEELFPDE